MVFPRVRAGSAAEQRGNATCLLGIPQQVLKKDSASLLAYADQTTTLHACITRQLV